MKRFFNFKRPRGYRFKTGDAVVDEIGNSITGKMGNAVKQIYDILEGQDTRIATENAVIYEADSVDIAWRGPGTADYRAGGHGAVAWAENYLNVRPDDQWVPLSALPSQPNPETGRSWAQTWAQQSGIICDCLQMVNSRFVYDQIVFCWPRGEGKSFLACLIALYKFFNFSKQLIVMGANSREQSSFVHFDIIRDLVLHSPKLLEQVGIGNVQLSNIRLLEQGVKGARASSIAPIASGTGILSNITCYTFSEIMLMRDPKFYTQLDSSRRNIINSLGIIDSTVSAKGHILHRLYKSWLLGESEKIYFNYRCSQTANAEDYMHPNMTQAQLNAFKIKYDPTEFDALLKNTWASGSSHLFAPYLIKSLDVLGVDDGLLNTTDIFSTMQKIDDLEVMAEDLRHKDKDSAAPVIEIEGLLARCKSLSAIYSIRPDYLIEPQTIEALGNVFKTDWALLTGIDMGDPLAKNAQARTVLTLVLKGLIGSRGLTITSDDQGVPKYIYLLVGLFVVPDHSSNAVAQLLDDVDSHLDGVDSVCIERYQGETVANWARNNIYNTEIRTEIVSPTYARQQEVFRGLGRALREGRLKAPHVAIEGSKHRDILREELLIFSHDPKAKKYASPEKFEARGIRDDTVYALAYALYGGRGIGVDQFRVRQFFGGAGAGLFGSVSNDKTVLGDYSSVPGYDYDGDNVIPTMRPKRW